MQWRARETALQCPARLWRLLLRNRRRRQLEAIWRVTVSCLSLMLAISQFLFVRWCSSPSAQGHRFLQHLESRCSEVYMPSAYMQSQGTLVFCCCTCVEAKAEAEAARIRAEARRLQQELHTMRTSRVLQICDFAQKMTYMMYSEWWSRQKSPGMSNICILYILYIIYIIYNIKYIYIYGDYWLDYCHCNAREMLAQKSSVQRALSRQGMQNVLFLCVTIVSDHIYNIYIHTYIHISLCA